MKLHVTHELSYNYSDEVHLNRHYFYLTPQPKPHQRLLDYNLEIIPQPEKLVNVQDWEDNAMHVCFANVDTSNFKVKTNFLIEINDVNPLSFMLFSFELGKLPFRYRGDTSYLKDYYLHKSVKESIIADLSDNLAQASQNNTIEFLLQVCSFINKNFRYEERKVGEAFTPTETLDKKCGTCRDFSVLMMAICSHQGLMTRFVSGYLYGDHRHSHDLHAWVEVFLLGAGWIGFDPTEGQVVNKNYIVLAHSIDSTRITPIKGSFKGKADVTSELITKIEIQDITC